MKTCTKCGETKAREEFPKHREKRDGLHSHCRECRRASTRAWEAANPERHSAHARAYYAKNRERILEHKRTYQMANSARIRAYRKANSARARTQRQAWYAANPELVRAYASNRRAIKREALAPNADLFAISELHRSAEIASWFFAAEEPLGFAVDHVVPLSRNGKHHEDNLRLLPARLNSVKGAKLDTEVTDADFLAYIDPRPVFEQVSDVVTMRSRRSATA